MRWVVVVKVCRPVVVADEHRLVGNTGGVYPGRQNLRLHIMSAPRVVNNTDPLDTLAEPQPYDNKYYTPAFNHANMDATYDASIVGRVALSKLGAMHEFSYVSGCQHVPYRLVYLFNAGHQRNNSIERND